MAASDGHRPSHRRGRSLSEALTLEHSEDGALVVSSINGSTSANQGLRRGDEILGATIDFDQLSKEEVLQVLKLMEPFDINMQVVTKNNRSKSIGNLDQYTKSPEAMLKDSYSKLYNAKIKRFMRNDALGEETTVGRDVTAKPTAPASSRDSLSHGTDLPRLGVDFGLNTNTLSADVNSDSQFEDVGEMMYGSNLNLPPLSLGSNGAQAPRLKVNARSPQLDAQNFRLSANLPEDPNVNTAAGVQVPSTDSPSGDSSMTNLDRSQTGLNINGNVSAPEVGLDLKGSHVSTPDMGINFKGDHIIGTSFDLGVPKVATERTNKEFKMPKYKLPNMGLSGSSFSSGSENQVKTPDVDTPDMPSGKLDLKFSKRLRKPDLNVDDPSSYAESPQVRLSGKSSDLDVEMPNIDVGLSQHDGNGPNVPSGEVKMQHKNSKMDLKTPDLDVDAPSGKLTRPKSVVSGKSEAHVTTPDLSVEKRKLKEDVCAPDVNLPKANLKGPNLAVDTTLVDNKGQSGKYKAPKFTMPKFDSPDIQDLAFNGDSVGPHTQSAAADLKPGIADRNLNLNVTSPHLDIASQSGKLTMPGLGQYGPDGKSADYGLKHTDMDARPKLKLFGTLPKKKHVYVGEGMTTPELTLKSPKKDGMGVPDLSVPNLDLKAPKSELHTPDVNVDSHKGRFTLPKLKLPSLGLSGAKGANTDVDASLNRLDLPSGGLDVDLSKPEFDIDSPSLDLKGPKSKLKIPDADIGSPSGKIKMPHIGLSGPKQRGLDGELKTPDFDISAPFKGTIGSPDLSLPKMDLNKPRLDLSGTDTPDMYVEAPSGKFQLSEFNLSGTLPKGPNFDRNTDLKSPDWSLTAPRIKGGIDPPELDLPEMDLKAPKFDVNGPNVNIGSPKSRLKMPKLKMPRFSRPSLKGPEVSGSFDGPDVNLNAPNVNFKGSKPDLDIPDANVSGPSLGKFKVPNVNLPDLGLSGPNLNDPDLDFKSSKLDIAGPNLSGGINAPDVDMTRVDFKNPKLDLTAPDVDVKMPSGKVIKPELNSPDWDVNAPSGKLKSPKFNLSGTLPKGPNLDLNSDLKSPDWSLTAPRIKGGIDAPDLNLPEMDLKAPKIDMNAPNVNIGSPKSRLKMPKLKMPRFSLPSLKGPEVSGSFDGPDVNLNAPKVNLKGSKADIDIPDANVSGTLGKFKMPNVNLPDLGLSGPKLDGPNLDLKSPGLDISGPKLSGGINTPDIDMTRVDFKKPKLDLTTPDFDLKMPSGKVIKPELNSPDWDVNAPSGKLKIPKFSLSGTLPKGPNLDLNSDLKSPDLSLTAPRIKGGIDPPDLNLPEMDLKAPKIDVNAPNVNIGSPKSRLKMPKLKMPKFGLPSLKKSEISGSFDGPDMNLNAPKVNLKGSKSDLDIRDANVSGPLGKFKMPNVNLPDLGLSGPKLDGPNLDLKSPGLDISGPNLSGGINAPDIDMTGVDFKKPKLGLTTPDFEVNMPSGKVIKPELHTPDWDVNAPSGKLKIPEFSLSGTLPKGPNLDLNSDLKSPDLSLTAPRIKGGIDPPDLNLPEMDLKAPKFDVNAPNVNIGSPKSRLKMPKLKMPRFSLPSLKGPDVSGSFDGPDVNLNAPKVNLKGSKADIDIPDANVSGTLGKFKMPNVNLPDLGLSGPKLDGPNLDLKSPGLDISGPKLSGGINTPDIDMTQVDFKKPKLGLTTPDFDLKMPSGKVIKPELHSPDWDVNAPSGKLKIPKFSLSGTLPKGPNLDLNSDLKSPDLSLTAPRIKGGIDPPDLNLPEMDLKAPKFDVNAPNVNIGSPKSRLKMPKLKMPRFSLPSLKGPEVSGSFDGPDVNLNAPKVNLKGSKADLDIPDANVSGTLGKFKMPNVYLSEFDLSRPKIDGPNLDLKSPGLDTSGPNLSGGINAPDLTLTGPKIKGGIDPPDLNLPKLNLKTPNLDVNAPNVNIGSPKGKVKMPKMKMPKFGFPSLKGPEINGSLEGLDANLNGANVNLKGPKADLEMPGFGISNPSVTLKKPNFNLPDFGLSGPKLNDPNLDLRSPKLDISGPNLGGGIKAPDINRPKVDLKSPKLNLNTPNLNLDMPSGQLDMPELHAPDWNVKAPPNIKLSGTLPKGPNMDINTDMKSPDLNMKTPNIKSGIRVPDLDLPNASLKTPKLDVDPDVNIGSPKAKLKMPKLKMPKFNLRALKGPGIDGNVKGPDVDLNAPAVDLSGSKADFGIDVNGPSGKFKKPNFHLPDFGLSGPKLDGPNLDLKSTDLDISGPKIRGGMRAPDLNMPDVDLKSPRMDFNAPKLDLEMPSGKLKMPSPKAELHPPHWEANAPSGKLKCPEPRLSGTLPKGPNMGTNADLDSPDFSLRSPRIKGGIDAPGIDLKSPKLDMNTPDVNIGFPEASIKKPKIEMPKGPHVDINRDLQGADLKIPNVDGHYENGTLKMPSLNTQGVRVSGPKANTLEMNMSGPKLKSRDRSMPDLDLLGTKFGGQPGMNFAAPQVKRGATGPDFDINVPSGNIQRPKSDLDLSDRKFKLTSFKLPQFGGPDLSRVGSDIDFSASLRSTNQNISPPNVKLNTKPPQLKGNITSPTVVSPNVALPVPKAVAPNPQVHFKNPDLNIDDASPHLKPYKNRRSGSKGVNTDLDVDRDVRLRHTDKKSSRTKTRSSYPQGDANLGFHIDFDRSDLNVDDFTGKDHVLRARASKVVPQPLHSDEQLISPSGVHIDMTDPRYVRGMPTGEKPQKTTRPAATASLPRLIDDSRIRIPDSTDGYYVTVFPTQAQSQKVSDRKQNTLGRPGLDPTNVVLDVPGENDFKGSTFFFSNLI